MTDFVTVSQTPDGLVTATLWLDSIYLLRLSSRATNVQASFTTETGLAPICTATGQMGPANKNCPDGMGLISLRCYSISCTGPLNGIDAAGGAAIFETSVTADFSICPPTQPNCSPQSAVSDTIRLRSPAITSGAARTSSSARTSASQTSTSNAPTTQTTTSKPTTATRTEQSISPTASTSNTPANSQSDSNNAGGGGSSVGMGVGIAVGVIVLAAIVFGVFRHRSRAERRKQRLARLSTISHTYPVAFTSAPRPPKKDGPSSAWNSAQPVGLTALEREAAETLARGGNAADPISHHQEQQSVVMSQVYAAGHSQQQQQPQQQQPQQQQPQQQQPQQQQLQQQQVYAQYVVPQQMQPLQPQQPQQAYVYPPTANTAQYPGYYDANGQYHFFNNQGPAPSHS
ncbi:hypothetical protein HDU80_004327 [Chytriomyces hyalinus]|nr:hypothetical protein HDU80_004327 [Chytriomyces hyalinus]